jgi:hypothetical protein
VHTIFAMIMWVGGAAGGPATIQGFHSTEACQAAIPSVELSFTETELNEVMTGDDVRFACVALDAGPEDGGYDQDADEHSNAGNPDNAANPDSKPEPDKPQ